MVNTWYTTDGCIGDMIGTTETTIRHKLGEVRHGVDGTEWVYVQANGAITQYDCVGIDESWQAGAITTAMVNDGWKVGVAQVAFADNEYGWVARRGAGSNLKVRAAASCAADVQLFTTATAGVLDDVSGTLNLIRGIVITTGNTSAAAQACILSYPQGAMDS